MKVLVILVGVVILAVAAGAFFYFKPSNVYVPPTQVTPVTSIAPIASATPKSTVQVSTQTLHEGKEISIDGVYVKNTSDRELQPGTADGASYQVIDTNEYGQIKIITGGFRMNCLAKEIYQPSKGELVEVYGKVVSNPSGQFFTGHTLSVCFSGQYYIKKK